MSYQSDLYTALAGNGPLAAIVGTRIFSDVADGSTAAPYVVYQTIATTSPITHDGNRTIEFPLIQLTAWATTRAGAITLANAILTVLDGNTLAGSSGLTCWFSSQSATHDEESNLYGEIIEIRAATNRT